MREISPVDLIYFWIGPYTEEAMKIGELNIACRRVCEYSQAWHTPFFNV